MNALPLISVIVANYNGSQFLLECLNSIIAQTYRPLEIIVADDGSTDPSPQIIKKFKQKFPATIKVIFSPNNRGVAKTRRQAIQQAQGEFLTTLDSDDYYCDPEKLKREMSLIQSHLKGGKNIIAFSNIQMVQEDGVEIGELGSNNNIKQGNIFTALLCRSCMIPRDYLVRTEIYHEVGGYNPSLKTHEDWDLKLKLAKKWPYYYTGSMGTAYRQHDQGLSSMPHWQRTENLWRVFNFHYLKTNIGTTENERAIKKQFIQFMKQRDKYYFQRSAEFILPRIKNQAIHAKWKIKHWYWSQENG